ncbi:hypothetical protein BHM04_11855 [Macrococcus sp. IME1552]|nr:capsular biosynthesis protein [Macrococcus sp. IME1552]ATD31836.1 hypothetical protein BHM04_11855 [Macrococcus sp. IME1552]
MIKRNFVNDTIKTMLGSLITALAIQFIIFPFLNQKVNIETFGLYISIYTILSMISVVVSNSLNNIRLINANYKPNIFYGEFITLFLIGTVTSFLFIILILVYYGQSIYMIILYFVFYILMSLRVYLIVFFRIQLNFSKLLITNILQLLGLLIGLLIYKVLFSWILIFICGEIISLIYIIYSLKLTVKSIELKKFFNKKLKQDYLNLLLINAINNIITYFDRLILLPILGGKAVSISFLSTFFSKTLANFIYPLNSVLLSYLIKSKNSNQKQEYIYTIIISISISLLSILIAFPFSLLIIRYVYKESTEAYINYIIIANLGVIFSIVVNILNSINLKYIDMKIQSNIQLITFFLFLTIIPLSTYYFNLQGFFLAFLILNFSKIIILLYVGFSMKYNK